MRQDPNNYRKHSDRNKELINKSLQKLGAGRSVLIDSEDYLIAGNGVSEQAEELGIPTRVIETDGTELIVVKRTDLTLDDPKRKELALADNATSDTSEWDVDALTVDWGEGDLEDWDVDIEWPEEAEPAEDPGPPEVKPEPETVLGDLYELNEHRVLCDSSTDSDAVAKLMNGKLFDLIVTDPPYNVDYTGKTADALTIDNDNMSDGDFYQFLLDYYTTAFAFTKPGGGIYVWHADSEGANFRKALVDGGFKLAQCLIWVKNSMVMGRQDYHWKHEPCLYGWKEGAAHNWYADRKQTTVLEFDRPTVNALHPTMKPIPLIKYQIENSSRRGGIVGDGFLGSGTTLMAAEESGRICYGTELGPNYTDVIVRRWVQYMEANSKPYTVKRNGEDITDAEWLKS